MQLNLSHTIADSRQADLPQAQRELGAERPLEAQRLGLFGREPLIGQAQRNAGGEESATGCSSTSTASADEVDVPMSTFHNLPGVAGRRVDAADALRGARGCAGALRQTQPRGAATFRQLVKISVSGPRHLARHPLGPERSNSRRRWYLGRQPPREGAGHRQRDRRAPAAELKEQARRRHRRAAAVQNDARLHPAGAWWRSATTTAEAAAALKALPVVGDQRRHQSSRSRPSRADRSSSVLACSCCAAGAAAAALTGAGSAVSRLPSLPSTVSVSGRSRRPSAPASDPSASRGSRRA